MKHLLPTIAVLWLAILAAASFAAQDRFTLQVPGGLAFSDFRGYEDWQTIAVSHNGDKLATILGNPAMIAAYKAILCDVLDKRPSGMRQRLAEALGKNRSFITQIANPAYQTPIPAQHVHPIIQVCHFSVQERDKFLEAYHRAHPRRLLLLKERERGRRLTLMLPDLGSEQNNHKLDSLLSEFAEKVARLIEES